MSLSPTVSFEDKKHRLHELPQPLAPLADTHGHLTVFRNNTAEQALAHAELAGVRMLVVPLDPSEDATDVPQTLAFIRDAAEKSQHIVAQELERQGATLHTWDAYPDLGRLADHTYILAGVHPYGARLFREDSQVEKRLHALLSSSLCVGVGEIGLDLGPYNELPLSEQLETFKAQLLLAHELNLPCELHLRDPQTPGDTTAHDAAYALLQQVGVPKAGCVLHCFTEGPEVAKPFIDLGCHLAFGGALTFAKSEDIRQAAAITPLDQLLSETDSPYMAPVPFRGLECESAMIAQTVARIAELKGQTSASSSAADKNIVQQTYRALWDNAVSLFGFSHDDA